MSLYCKSFSILFISLVFLISLFVQSNVLSANSSQLPYLQSANLSVSNISDIFSLVPHQKVFDHNMQIIQNSSFIFMRPSFATTSSPDYKNPIPSAFFYFTLSPSVDLRISANESNRLIWVWGTDAPPSASFSANLGGCAPDQFIFTQISAPKLSGTLQYSSNNFSDSIQFDSNTSNLLNLNLRNLNKSQIQVQNSSSVLAKLNFDFEGLTLVGYSVTHNYYRLVSSGKSTVCVKYSRHFLQSYSHPIKYSKTYELEYSSPYFLILSPADLEQTSISEQIKFLSFSNLQAQKIKLNSDDATLALSVFADYGISTDELNFQNIVKQNIIPNDSSKYSWVNKTFSNTRSISNYNATVFSNSSFGFEPTSSFFSENYVYSYYTFYHGPLGLGLLNVSLILLDDFNREHSENYTLRVRDISSISLDKNVRIISGENVNDFTTENNSFSSFSNSKYLFQYESNKTQAKILSNDFLRGSKSIFTNYSNDLNVWSHLPIFVLALIGIGFFIKLRY